MEVVESPVNLFSLFLYFNLFKCGRVYNHLFNGQSRALDQVLERGLGFEPCIRN